MDFKIKQQEIDGILKTLDEAKRYSGLGPDDPAVVELERIMIAKVAELEAAKTEAVQALGPVGPEPAATVQPPLLFAAAQEEMAHEQPKPIELPK